jgi:hypothetical protein
MSWSKWQKPSNSIHSGFPALAHDGNLYTDWSGSESMNNTIKKTAGTTSNYSYRQWLIHNGVKMINLNTKSAEEHGCGHMTDFEPVENSNKYIFKGGDDTIRPFGYEDSDLKQLYLNESMLHNRMSAPIMTQHEMLEQRIPTAN